MSHVRARVTCVSKQGKARICLQVQHVHFVESNGGEGASTSSSAVILPTAATIVVVMGRRSTTMRDPTLFLSFKRSRLSPSPSLLAAAAEDLF